MPLRTDTADLTLGDGDWGNYLAVRKVPLTATSQQVLRHFSQFGRVTHVDLVDASPRIALVHFEHERERLQCFVHGIAGDEPGVREYFPERGVAGYYQRPVVLHLAGGRTPVKAKDVRACIPPLVRQGQVDFEDPGVRNMATTALSAGSAIVTEGNYDQLTGRFGNTSGRLTNTGQRWTALC